MKSIIVAYDNERAIGVNNQLLWDKKDFSPDMRRFRSLTKGHAIIMGRKTLESIGIALPERKNIVITHSNEVYIPEVEIAHSLNEAYRLADDEDMFIIGGGEIYRQALADVERIYATKIEHTFENSDTFFPDLDESWEESLRTDYINSDKTKYPFRFITYTRK